MNKAQLAEHFYIDDTSPSGLRWLKVSCTCMKAGDVAGYLSSRYYLVGLAGRRMLAHRIIAVLAGLLDSTANELHIDHIDGNRLNNSPTNLRAVTNRQNHNNCHTHRAGRLVGATAFRGKWMGYIHVGGKQVYLGMFPTEQLAHEAYMTYRQKHGLL